MDRRIRDGVLERVRQALATMEEAGFDRRMLAPLEDCARVLAVSLYGDMDWRLVDWRMPVPLWADSPSVRSGDEETAHTAWASLMSAQMDLQEADAKGFGYVDKCALEYLRRACRLLEVEYDSEGKWEERR